MALCAGPGAWGTPVEALLRGIYPCHPGIRQWAFVRTDRRWVAPCYRMTGVTLLLGLIVLLWALTDQEHRAQAILRCVAGPGLLKSLETLLHDEVLDGEVGGHWARSRFWKPGCRLP